MPCHSLNNLEIQNIIKNNLNLKAFIQEVINSKLTTEHLQ